MPLNNTLFPPIVETNPAPFVYGKSGNHLIFENPIGDYNGYGIGFKIISPYGEKLFEDMDSGADSNYLKSPNGNKIELSLVQSIITENYIHNQYYKIQLRFRKDTDYSPWSSTILIKFISNPIITDLNINFAQISGKLEFENPLDIEGFKSYQIVIKNEGLQIYQSSNIKFSSYNNSSFKYIYPIQLDITKVYQVKINFITANGYEGTFDGESLSIVGGDENKILTISAKSYPDLGGIMVNFNSTGGENLILNSGRIYESPEDDKYLVHSYEMSKNWKADTIYTLSIKGSLPKDQKWGVWANGRNKQVSAYKDPECKTSYADGFIPVSSNFSIAYLKLQEVPDLAAGLDKPHIYIFNCPSKTAGEGGTIEWIKLEEGAVPLKDINWSPSSEDPEKKCTLMRSTHKTNFCYWEILGTINFGKEKISWLDITAESGVWYKYKIISDPEEMLYYTGESNPVLLDLDSIFLSDENTQFLVSLNEDVSSFKYVVSESVTNTLGSKFPFVRRNAETKYRQFNLGGIISFLADENYNAFEAYEDSCFRDENSFLSGEGLYPGPMESEDGNRGVVLFKDALFLTKQQAFQDAVNLYNTYSQINGYENFEDSIFERAFRDQAMEFLTNGKPKLFRSTTEGNILIMLTNVSFTPNKQLGRRIYSFTATATEIAECNIENYKKYNILREEGEIVSPYILALYGESVEGSSLTLASESISENKKAIVFFQIDDLEV